MSDLRKPKLVNRYDKNPNIDYLDKVAKQELSDRLEAEKTAMIKKMQSMVNHLEEDLTRKGFADSFLKKE
jgi:hypothetical protein